MTGSRCLQCGVQLPVFRKLTGGGDFCSDAHRHSYQEELNRIALTRLMRVRPRQEEAAAPANGRGTSKSAAAEPVEPEPPAPAGFICTQFGGGSVPGKHAFTEEPLPVFQSLQYPERLVAELDQLELSDALAPEVVTTEPMHTSQSSAPESILPLAERISNGIAVTMCLTEPEIRSDLAPAEFSAPALHLGDSSILRTIGISLEEEEIREEPIPPHATFPREIAIRTLEPSEPEIVRGFEAIPFEPFRPQMPELDILPLRPAITFAPPPQQKGKKEVPPAPASKISQPRPVTKAPPAPALERKEKRAAARITPNAPAVTESRPSTTETKEDPLQSSPSLTLGMPSSDMGSPVFRFWYSTPAKVKVAIATGLLGIVVFSALSKNAGKREVSPTAGLAATAPAPGFLSGNIEMGGGGWVTEWAGDSAGSKRGKQLTLYKPSMSLQDYRTEFVGQIETKGLGWVFRAKDARNYYAMKVRIVRPGIEPGVVLTRYAVADGIEGPLVDVPLNLTVRNDTLYKVKVEVEGATFTTYIQGKVVDIWSDDRLKIGGFGFSNERGERAHIRSVSVSF